MSTVDADALEKQLGLARHFLEIGRPDRALAALETLPGGGLDEPRAGLPALPATALDTEAELLAQILYERRYELYSQGLRWEDLRRLSAYTTRRPSIEFLPYPQSECDRNPADPC